MKKLRHDVARRDHYEELTNTIIAKLEDGVLPWRSVTIRLNVRTHFQQLQWVTAHSNLRKCI